MAKCIECNELLEGRTDQKFCSDYCKSSFHYKKNKNKRPSTYIRIDNQLKLNRNILKKYNQSGQSQIRKELLLNEGFNFKYYTQSWTAKNGNLYHFCYEYGFRDLNDGKYTLIIWQNYMD
jgi:hypothetical protein